MNMVQWTMVVNQFLVAGEVSYQKLFPQKIKIPCFPRTNFRSDSLGTYPRVRAFATSTQAYQPRYVTHRECNTSKCGFPS